ncbi:MAG: OB-fold nucleic acid binding domain-containing protein, partial [Rhizobiaceae bacterium]
RLGFRQIKGLGKDRMEAFVRRREAGYTSVHDVWLRSGLDIGEIEKLAEGDAFRSLGLDRRQALWEVRALSRRRGTGQFPLLDRPRTDLLAHEEETRLPEMPLGEHVIHDYRSLGLSLKAHPVSFLRKRLERAGITPNAALPQVPNGRRVSVAGLVLVRQRPGKGNAIFLTLEDEHSVANIIVWAKSTFERFRPVIMGGRFVRVTGKLQTESGVVHIVAETLEDLTPWLIELSEKARHIETHVPADEVRRGSQDPRLRGSRLATQQKAAAQTRDMEELWRETREVMPKGRNFQ